MRVELRDAVQSSFRQLRHDADDANAWHELGCMLARLGEPASAFNAFRNALLLDDMRATTFLALGRLLFDSGQPDAAMDCFECAERVMAREPAPCW
jgi:Tfp pilus assembly protein PilF